MTKPSKRPFPRILLFCLIYSCFLISGFLVSIYSFPTELASSDSRPKVRYFKVGMLTDIHAASQDERVTNYPGNTIYPNKYTSVLPKYLDEMREAGVKLVFNLGDNTNHSSKKHAKIIREIGEKSRLPVHYVKGNHDTISEEIMPTLGQPEKYYYFDYDQWRFIILDSSEAPGNRFYIGGISRKQFEWLQEALDTTNQVFIAMHHPIWEKEDTEKICPEYSELEKMLSESGNVKYMAAGHWHVGDWNKTYNGIKYYQIPALTLSGSENNFAIINLPVIEYNNEIPQF